MVRNFASAVLSDAKHSVLTANNGEKALKLYRDRWQEIDLVILDMIMPRMNGREAFVAMKEINPDIKVIVASGYSMNEDKRIYSWGRGNCFYPETF